MPVIFEQQSPYEFIRVIDDGDLRSLIFDNEGSQSTISKINPDQIIMEYVEIMFNSLTNKDPNRVLVFGLGGGELVSKLNKKYNKLIIDAVEVDPVVIKVAHTYFSLPYDKRINIYMADALKFIQRAENMYDAIFIDAYGKDGMPTHLQFDGFFQEIKDHLIKGGFAAMNLYKMHLNSFAANNFKDIFPKNWSEETIFGGNVVLFGENNG